jgi:hypothetical protein
MTLGRLPSLEMAFKRSTASSLPTISFNLRGLYFSTLKKKISVHSIWLWFKILPRQNKIVLSIIRRSCIGVLYVNIHSAAHCNMCIEKIMISRQYILFQKKSARTAFFNYYYFHTPIRLLCVTLYFDSKHAAGEKTFQGDKI